MPTVDGDICPVCPFCGSADTDYDPIMNNWICNDCNEIWED